MTRLFSRKGAPEQSSGGLPPPEVKTYHCGTLTYTKAGVVSVFAWLLWGDFCFSIMEKVVPSVLPLNLKALGAPNWLMGMIVTTLPGILNMTICPWISFKSDRYRGRWGRRIPFIVWTLPFLCLSLILLGCSGNISVWLHSHVAPLQRVLPATLTVALIGVFMVAFQFFNMFVGSVYWYLFNDVVPAQYLSRFTGSFRIVGNLATGLYSFFIYKYAASNMREILIGASLLYFFGFGLMCIMVKEGRYPPIEDEEDRASRGLRGVKTFLQESFCHKWYVLFFAWTAVVNLYAGIGTFGVFFNQEMGLTLDQIGKVGAVSGFAVMIAMYLASVYIDRWHPMRVQVYLGNFAAITALSSWIWVFVTLPGKYFFWLFMGTSLLGAFAYALTAVCSFPLWMRVLPKSRFGQFCSAQAIVASVALIISGVISGLYVDGIAQLCRRAGCGSYFVYRFNFAWQAFFLLVMAALGVWAYVYWHRLGADQGYKAPAPWSPNQVEELDVVPTIGPQSRWLNLSLRLFNATMLLSVLALPVLMWWMHRRQALIAYRWYAILILPYSLAVWIGWKFLERGIRRDMARALKNEPLHNGIPHHGVLMVVAVQYLLALGVWLAEVIVTVRLSMEWECILFGIANILTNSLLITAVLVTWRMERGRSNTLGTGQGDATGGVRAWISALFRKKPIETANCG